MKKIFTILAVVCVAFAFTSCGVESKMKGFMDEEKELQVRFHELSLELAELEAEKWEYLSELDKDEVKEYVKNQEKWQKEIDKEYRDELQELEREIKNINDDAKDFKKKYYKKESKIEFDAEDLMEEWEEDFE